jgi:hypothetical protein
VGVWDEIATGAARESDLWRDALLPNQQRQLLAVFSPLAEDRFALGIETIYEGYLVHYGRPRLFGPPDGDTALLLGDYLYAHGLVRIAALGDVAAVSDLAGLISLCAQLRADGREGDGAAWAATAALLATGRVGAAAAALRNGGDASSLRALAVEAAGAEAVAGALAAHAGCLG